MYVDILILAELTSQPYHGYELKRRVERILGGTVTINANQLYPTLRRFEEMGAVSREVERQLGKPDRHIYSITDRGLEVLQDLLQDFPPEIARSDAEFGSRVAYFHLLEPRARLAILTTREQALRHHLQHLEQSQKLVSENNASQLFYVAHFLSFQQQQLQHELAWLSSLIKEVETR
ncbi:PadR family transcriptional regulator [Ktedonosporobacter rubrisoli]|uniref:PadR family transcriptional regulator n=1 Tax=Ktedonosporobacter rubrisoli TaxID=2509675 RepID=A0A4V0Z0I1_KTERU|nr:PadR family transcriptional regulator [Ktedonosporobacter rubrisoli]QBD83301.1 PadR family transcriptional regulator [Ktedonosporobacter rubrisoli]